MTNSFKNIEPLVATIEHLATTPEQYCSTAHQRNQVTTALNGQLSKTLRDVVPLATLQEFGAFFTSDSMADQLIADLTDQEIAKRSVFDPACGGGNLLLAYARRLPLQATLSATVETWGRQIFGYDIQSEFIRSTRARLVLLAFQRGYEHFGNSFFDDALYDLSSTFPNLQTCDALEAHWPSADVTLLNPPYNRVPVDEECKWATGRVSHAAKFMIKAANNTIHSAIVRAILPDVLRAGSNYRAWRNNIAATARVSGIRILGQFDTDTNVDVFLLSLESKSNGDHCIEAQETTHWSQNPSLSYLSNSGVVGDLFKVSVGRVVPHRDKEIGTEFPYLHAKALAPWGIVGAIDHRRKFTGVTFNPPFVVIRRSSRSSDKHRAVATIIKAASSKGSNIAVENHLIVVQPKSGLLRDCQKLLKILQLNETSQWLNERIRCRHLTVSAVENIPWWNL